MAASPGRERTPFDFENIPQNSHQHSRAAWGTGLWGTGITDLRAAWGTSVTFTPGVGYDRAAWGTYTLSASRAAWGTSGVWSDRAAWGTTTGAADLTSTAIQGE